MQASPEFPTTMKNGVACRANKIAEKHGVDLSKLPNIVDMSAESITENVHAINANCPDERIKFIFKNLVQHLHDFVRETSITSDEWTTAINFLTETGHREEFILLSDALGVSSLVDSINNVKPPGATEATLLGPFFAEDAHEVKNGDSIATEIKGDYMFVEGHVLDLSGNPIAGAVIDTWETDDDGLYDTRDYRGKLHSDAEGKYSFRAILPHSYPVPTNGPVGRMVNALGRHDHRPAHLHIMIQAPGYETLVTALYMKGDPFLTSDAVFGVRSSLIVDPKTIEDTNITLARGFKEAKSHKLLRQDFILPTPAEVARFKKKVLPALP